MTNKPEDISLLLAAYSDSVISQTNELTTPLDSLNPMPEDSLSFRGLDVIRSEEIDATVLVNTHVHARYNRSPPTDIHENIVLRGTPKSFELLGRFFEQLDTVVRTSSLHVLHFLFKSFYVILEPPKTRTSLGRKNTQKEF